MTVRTSGKSILARAISPLDCENSRTVLPSFRSRETRWRPTKPLAPVTSGSLGMAEKAGAHAIKIVHCLHVIVHAADIQPVSTEALHVNRPAFPQKSEHQVV